MASVKLPVFMALGALTAMASAEDLKVWASVVVARGGDRVPQTGSMYSGFLTNLGAVQMQGLGQWLRNWYLSDDTGLPGLDQNFIQPGQLYVLASDAEQSTVASAQALLQGLYPPANDTGGYAGPLGSSTIGPTPAPLDNYQYPLIKTAGQLDQESIYVNGAQYCPNFLQYLSSYEQQAAISATNKQTMGLYAKVGSELEDANLPSESYSYWNAAQAWEYVNYLNTHNKTASAKLSSGKLRKLDASTRLRYLSDQYQWNLYGSLNATDPISTIAGQTLARQVVDLLSINIGSVGVYNKLSILVGDYTPIISFFGLANLQDDSSDGFNEDITGMPNFASAGMFEVVAPSNAKLYSDGSGDKYPSPADLRVRFGFRNGTEIDGSESAYIDYALFGTGMFDMSWEQFSTSMNSIAIADTTEWCGACNAWASSPFCMLYNTTAYEAAFGNTSGGLFGSFGSGLSPVVAGVIGAFVTIALFLLIVVPLIVFAGLRFRMEKKTENQSNNGGFKGGQKMASDADLTVVKGRADVNVEDYGTKERIGSWELKNQAAADRALGETLQPPQNPAFKASRPESFVSSVRPSFDAHDPVTNPFQEPVKPREHV